jgi:hypothetical protein
LSVRRNRNAEPPPRTHWRICTMLRSRMPLAPRRTRSTMPCPEEAQRLAERPVVEELDAVRERRERIPFNRNSQLNRK